MEPHIPLFRFVLALAGLSLLAGCVSQNGASPSVSAQAPSDAPPFPPLPPSRYGWETFRESSDPSVILAGMPSDEALDIFAARGGTTIINLRTDKEMEAFPGYRESIEARGLNYVHVPTSGSTMGAATYAPVAEALDAAGGPVLMHCASGGRATYTYAMRRIDREGMSAQDAGAWCTERRGKPWDKGLELLAEFEAENIRSGG